MVALNVDQLTGRRHCQRPRIACFWSDQWIGLSWIISGSFTN